MKNSLLTILIFCFLIQNIKAQVGINATGTAPNPSAMLDVNSTTKGLLIPRMTTAQKNAIATKPSGLMVFDISLNQFSYWNGTSWIDVSGVSGGGNQWTTNGDYTYNTDISGNVGIGTISPVTPTSPFPSKLTIYHGGLVGGRGLLVQSTSSNSSIIIDGFDGEAKLRFFKKESPKWELGSTFNNNNFKIINSNLDDVVTILSNNNNVGIGTTNPIAKLHVANNSSVSTGQGYFFYYNAGLSTNPAYTANLGILADYGIVSKTYVGSALNVIASDNRIKNIIGLSNNSEDLALLKKIEITNYRMKDVTTWGNQTFKKVIAQQVESVYPEVIKKQTSVIPDIYTLAESVVYDAQNKKLSISMCGTPPAKDYGIKIGDKIELIHPEKGKIQAEVVEVLGKTFTVKDWEYPTDKIFVFGREVNDFRSVDYEALSMLGISAIQALAKENEEMKKEIIDLKKLKLRIEAIEATLNHGLTMGK